MKEFKNQWVRSGSGVPYFKYNVKEDKGVRCYEVEEKKFGLVLGTWYLVEPSFNASDASRQYRPVKIRPRSGLCFLLLSQCHHHHYRSSYNQNHNHHHHHPYAAPLLHASPSISLNREYQYWDIGMQTWDSVSDISDRIWCLGEGCGTYVCEIISIPFDNNHHYRSS